MRVASIMPRDGGGRPIFQPCVTVPSMNFGQRGQMRQRLRAYLSVRMSWLAGLPGRGFRTDYCAVRGPRVRQDRPGVGSCSLAHARGFRLLRAGQRRAVSPGDATILAVASSRCGQPPRSSRRGCRGWPGCRGGRGPAPARGWAAGLRTGRGPRQRPRRPRVVGEVGADGQRLRVVATSARNADTSASRSGSARSERPTSGMLVRTSVIRGMLHSPARRNSRWVIDNPSGLSCGGWNPYRCPAISTYRSQPPTSSRQLPRTVSLPGR